MTALVNSNLSLKQKNNNKYDLMVQEVVEVEEHKGEKLRKREMKKTSQRKKGEKEKEKEKREKERTTKGKFDKIILLKCLFS